MSDPRGDLMQVVGLCEYTAAQFASEKELLEAYDWGAPADLVEILQGHYRVFEAMAKRCERIRDAYKETPDDQLGNRVGSDSTRYGERRSTGRRDSTTDR